MRTETLGEVKRRVLVPYIIISEAGRHIVQRLDDGGGRREVHSKRYQPRRYKGRVQTRSHIVRGRQRLRQTTHRRSWRRPRLTRSRILRLKRRSQRRTKGHYQKTTTQSRLELRTAPKPQAQENAPTNEQSKQIWCNNVVMWSMDKWADVSIII
jgi:hypothetical protein